MPQREHWTFLIDRNAALAEALGEATQIIQRMNAAGARIEHAANKGLRAGLIAHLKRIEDPHLIIPHLALHPGGFVDRSLQCRLIMRGLDLAAARQPRAANPEFRHQLFDRLDRFMRNLVHAFRHRAAMGGVDVAERQPEFCGDDAAIAAARAPTWLIGFEHDRRQTALGDVMRGRQSV